MKGKKRIVFTVSNDLSYDQRMQRICRSLSNGGYEVELIGRERSLSIPLSNEPYKQTRLKCFFDKGKLFYLEYNLRLFFYLFYSEFDAACAIDLDTIVPVYVTGKVKGAKLIYDAHEYFTEVPEVISRPAVKKVWEWVERTFVPKFDLVYTVSPSLADLFSKKYSRPVHTIMNLPERLEIRNQKSETRTFTILYQGALNKGRGLEQLLEAMTGIEATLKIAGEGDLSEELRDMCGRLQLQSKVEFLGFRKPEELKEITAKADIGINLLADEGLSYHYSLSNKFFDYIHAGLPQVCTSQPEYERINKEYEVAVLINSCTPDEIRNGIARLIRDVELYRRLQKNCEVCSRFYNWDTEEKKLLTLYDDLLG